MKLTWFEKGQSFYAAGNYDKAIEAYTKALELDPTDARAYIHRGITYDELDDPDQTIRDYDKAIELDPTAARYCLRGIAYADLGDQQRAIKDYDRAIELNPEEGMTYFIRGFAYANLGDHQQAIEDYDKAIELDHKLAGAYFRRGIAYGKLGNFKQAIRDYGRAIELNPEDAEAYSHRGFAYANLGDYQQTIEDYDRAIELNPKDATAYYNRGLAYERLGNYQPAIKDCERAIELNPEDAEAYCLRNALAVSAAPFIDEAIKVTFPQQIGTLKLQSREQYEEPGLGYGLRYQDKEIFRADVYVYDNNLRDIEDGPYCERVRQEFDSVLSAIAYMEQIGKYKALKQLERGTTSFAKGSLQFLWSRCQYRQTQAEGVVYFGPEVSETYLSAKAGKFIKVRVNLKQEEFKARQAEIDGFMKHLARILGNSQQSPAGGVLNAAPEG